MSREICIRSNSISSANQTLIVEQSRVTRFSENLPLIYTLTRKVGTNYRENRVVDVNTGFWPEEESVPATINESRVCATYIRGINPRNNASHIAWLAIVENKTARKPVDDNAAFLRPRFRYFYGECSEFYGPCTVNRWFPAECPKASITLDAGTANRPTR